MKITDAVRSGIRFRRPSTGYWLQPNERLFLDSEDILATDWFLDEQAVELRASQVREAFHAAFKEMYKGSVNIEELLDLALQKLGLKVSEESADKD
jgi:hypothetical protein